jgi:hypothetical protein
MLANDFVDDALVRRERVEALLLNLGPGILGGVQKDVVVMRSWFSWSTLPAAIRRMPIARRASPAAASATR